MQVQSGARCLTCIPHAWRGTPAWTPAIEDNRGQDDSNRRQQLSPVGLFLLLRAQVSEFKGRWGVDVRETYGKDGVAAPGKKGAPVLLQQEDLLGQGLP